MVVSGAAHIRRQLLAQPRERDVAAGVAGVYRGQFGVAGEIGRQVHPAGHGNRFERRGRPVDLKIFPAVRRGSGLRHRVDVGRVLVVRLVVRLDVRVQLQAVVQVVSRAFKYDFRVQRRDDVAAGAEHDPSSVHGHGDAVGSDEFPGAFDVDEGVEQQFEIRVAGQGQIDDFAMQHETGRVRYVDGQVRNVVAFLVGFHQRQRADPFLGPLEAGPAMLAAESGNIHRKVFHRVRAYADRTVGGVQVEQFQRVGVYGQAAETGRRHGRQRRGMASRSVAVDTHGVAVGVDRNLRSSTRG